MRKFMTATEARKKWYDLVEFASKPGNHVVITHRGLPRIALVSFVEFEQWQEKAGKKRR